MKARKSPNERGQVLIIIAFAAVALFAFTALAIDGSMVFSDRRHSQNASDTAVLAAALDKVRGNPASPTWQTSGLARAADNDYDDADADTEVYVRSCGDANLPVTSDGVQVSCSGLPSGANPNEYIVVHIKSVVHLTFARIIGRQTIINHTDAVSRATDPITTNWFDGYGIASLHEGCADPGEGDPFELGGSALSVVNGAGVLVNSTCATAFVHNGNASSLDTATGVCVAGGVKGSTTDITPPPTIGCDPVDPSQYQMPSAPDCANAGSITEISNGVWLAKPGYFTKEFPDVKGGQASIRLTKGVYCLKAGLKVGAGWNMTTDLDGDGHDGATEGAFFYLENGDFDIGGGGDIVLHAISSSSSLPPEWINMLMYVPPSNEADITLTGNSGSTFTGTILAPSSHVHLLGSNGTTGGNVYLDSQIIADTVKITGNTDFVLTYNESNNATTITNPGIELIE